MTLKSCLLLAAGLALLPAMGPLAAEEVRTGRLLTTADGAPEKRTYRRKRPPLEIDIYAQRRRRPGGYSYGVPDITSTYNSRNPPPYAHVRQTPSGPFDSGFWFDSGCCGLHAGDAPYPH
jgi:hypothetical protein